MLRPILALALTLAATAQLPAQEGILFRWTFDEGQGETVRDVTGNGFDGAMRAEWIDTPAGQGAFLDGTGGKHIRLELPPEQRFGKGSWSFMAWVKPTQFAIESRQNQRRIFDYGKFPDANLVLDISGTGRLTSYFCYKTAEDKSVTAGGNAPVGLELDQWAHLAAVVDRAEGKVYLYVNGFAGGGSGLPANFDGDFSVSGQLSVGSGWQNYWGALDEVSVYRRALSPEEVRAEFLARRQVFGVEESPAMRAAMQQEAIAKVFGAVAAAWSAGNFAAVRDECAKVLAVEAIPAHYRSYAHLRIAQSYAAEGNSAAARAEYTRIAAQAAYPEVHRREAEECAREIGRAAQGLPARDPQATRTPIPAIDSFAAEFFVSPRGNDRNDGSRQRPFATLGQARNAVREVKKLGVKGPVAVRLLPGEYPMLGTFELTAEDSGSAGAPVVYRAEELGKAVLYGGARLAGFVPVTDPAILARLPESSRGRVVQLDLRARGITDYGELKVRGFGQPAAPPTLELYFDGQPMTLARWPNEGFVGIRELVQPGSRADGIPSVIGYLDDRHARWTQAEDPWIFGYFHFLWADATARIGRIDPEAKTLTTAEPYHYGGRGMDPKQGIIYHAFNLLEEIDRPGEWYLNRNTGILYFYPPSDPNRATVEIGMLDMPMIALNGVEDVRLEGLTLDLARANGIVAAGSSRCLIAGCTVKRMAGNGITIQGGEENGLFGCDIHTIGRRASEVIGGDRETLTPARHFVENCRIYHFGRIDRTYTPAIQLEGVGNRVAHNLMYQAPSSVMRIEGNDHLMEYNDVHSAVTESDDQGAMELFRNATYRGVVFRHNRFRNVGKTGTEGAVHGQAAIRFDDAISGMLVYGNLFVRSSNGNFGAVQMNSGRDNLMDNNLFVDCARGISGGWHPGNSVWRMLRENLNQPGFFTNELYLARYPEIATMLDEPAVNRAWRNVFVQCGAMTTGNAANLDLFQNLKLDADPGFMGPDDYRLKPDSPVFRQIGFRPLPLEEVGLYEHPLRATWPVETTPVPIRDWRK